MQLTIPLFSLGNSQNTSLIILYRGILTTRTLKDKVKCYISNIYLAFALAVEMGLRKDRQEPLDIRDHCF